MEEKLQTAVEALQQKFGAEVKEFRAEITLFVDAKYVVDALQTLKEDHHFEMLMDLTAVDYWPQEKPRFHIIYQLYSMTENLLLRIRVPLDGNSPEIQTVETVYPNANWKEREIWDMFGVKFNGHSDLRRIVLPYDWEGHPLRKDSPLGYEEVQFTFNYDEIELRKPHSTGVRDEIIERVE